MIDQKKELTYQYACKHYLRTKSLEKLRAYGRSIGVNRSTAKNKGDLIDDIVGVLSGRLEPQFTKKGAPVLNGTVDPEIPQRIKMIYEEIFEVKLKEDHFAEEYQKLMQSPNRILIEEPDFELRENGAVFAKKKGQLTQIQGVYYLLPLDGKDNGEHVVLHAELVERNALLEGDVVVCDALQGKNAFVASTVLEINGESIQTFRRENTLERLPCEPTRSLSIYDGVNANFVSCKYLEWLAPIRKGQRCCVIAPPKTGKSRLLQELAQSARALNPDVEIFALLIDQPLETVGSFARFLPAENLLYTTYEDEVERQVFLADFILKRAKRFAESGKDVVLFVDSFQALGKAFNDTDESMGGKTLPCGLESKTLQYLKKYLGAARCDGGKGTLTIIGTATTDTGNPFDDVIAAEIAPTLNHEIRLSAEMAYKRLYPALDRTQIYVERRELSAEERMQDELINKYLQQVGAEKLLHAVLQSADRAEFEKRIKTAL